MQAAATHSSHASHAGSSPNPSIMSHLNCTKVIEVATAIFKNLFAVSFGILLYIINPTLSISSFLVGVIFSDQVSDAIKKISTVWNSQKTIGCITLSVACYLALPVTIAASAILYSAYWGSHAYQSAIASNIT